MRIDIDKIVPNPFRDFEVDPIDQHQVDRLAASIGDLGFFSGVTARKRADGKYELAAGHHRVEAAKQADMGYVEAVVDNYSDNDMRRIMAIENLTQRGAHSGAQLDAVQAFARQVAYEVLTDRKSAQNRADFTPAQQGAARASVLKDGPGERLIYQAINGFARDEAVDRKAEDPKAEMISQHDVKSAVKKLKDSGRMAKIVARAYAVVEKERKEDEAKAAEVERKAEEKRKAAEAAAAAELKRRKEAEEEADRRAKAQREAAAKAAEAAAKASAAKRVEAERKAAQQRAAAEASEAERAAAAKHREKAEEEAKRKAAAEAARRAGAEKDAKAKAAREAEERAKVKAQQERETVYDIRCDKLFPDPAYAETFRKHVTYERVRAAIPRDEQFKVAQKIVKGMKDWKDHSNQKLGTDYIVQVINEIFNEYDGEERKRKEDMEAAFRAVNARMRVDNLWRQVAGFASRMDSTMRELVEEHKKWRPEDGDFPVNIDITNAYGTLGKLEEMMRRMYGGRMGIPVAESEAQPQLKRISGK